MFKAGDKIRFVSKKVAKGYIPYEYNLNDLSLGETCGKCTSGITKNEGTVINANTEKALVEFFDKNNKRGVLVFPNKVLELREEIVNNYTLF